MKRKLAAVILVALAAFMMGCIEYQEEMWLNADGSGKAMLKIGMVSQGEGEEDEDFAFDVERTAEMFEKTPGVTVTSKRGYSENERDWLELEIEFDSLAAFQKVTETGEDTDFIGKFSLRKPEKGVVVFNRKVQAGEGESPANLAMTEGALKGFTWSYIVHFPSKILESNAPQENVDIAANTVKWSYSLLELAQGPQTMSVTFAAPQRPERVPLGLIIIILAVVVAVIAYLSLKKRK